MPSAAQTLLGCIPVSGIAPADGEGLFYNATTGQYEPGAEPGGGDMLKSVYDPTNINNSAFNRANHTGTQAASTISDFDTTVTANANVAANTTHRTSDGTNHTFINQDLRTTASPVFAGISIPGIGDGSEKYGLSALAGGLRATSVGKMANAGGTDSLAIGESAVASGANSISVGRASSATMTGATAVGQDADVTGAGGVAIGSNADVGGAGSIAIGENATTGAFMNALAIGQGAAATADNDGQVGTVANKINITFYGTSQILTGDTFNSAMHIGELVDEGGYFTSATDMQLLISGGAEWVTGVWTARSTAAALLNLNNGELIFYGNAGLVDGNGFVPTEQFKVDINGYAIFVGASKSTTGDPAGVEGMLYFNTFDNAIKLYADGAWRTLASW